MENLNNNNFKNNLFLIEDNKLPISEELNELSNFITTSMTKELPTLNVDVDYFILAVLIYKRNSLFNRLNDILLTTSMQVIYDSFYQVVSSKILIAIKNNRVIKISQQLKELLKKGEQEAIKHNSSELKTDHIFLAILADKDENNKIKKVFNKAGITYKIFVDNIKKSENEDDVFNDVSFIKFYDHVKKKIETNSDNINMIQNTNKKSTKFINSYCTNLNELVRNGKIDALVGREKEVNEIIRILGRKKKNNAILLGSEGVGKTAIGESIAYKIVNNEVPAFLLEKTLVSLDMTAVLAGTTLRGMFEERIKGILDEIKADPSFILFIDNIGAVLADKNKNDIEISSMLSRALENGDIQVIGTSDFISYRKTFDKDPSLARRFQKILVEAPSVEESLNIINGVKKTYEDFHCVKYTDEAIKSCVLLADKYITERNLPDSAIDILDEIGSLKGTINESDKVKELTKQMAIVKNELKGLYKNHSDKEDTLKIVEKQNELENLIEEFTKETETYKEYIKNNPIEITKDDILNIVSVKTNIPVNNLTADDKKKLLEINDRIKQNVIGQDDAIDTICKALKRNRIGLNKNGCMYSCMAIGKTGIGKTLIAKQLAKELFGSEKALVRFDMSEFSDKVAVNKLIGSNPGYVGYEEGGQLTETIKNKKHCVLLLDEIEKADPEIYNIFLQVLDEGFLTDNSGQKVDFKNVIVIFTSNIGAKTASDFGNGIGFKEDVDVNSKRILLKELKKKFPPEFLNRIDDVIYFNSLTNDDLKKIIKLELNKFKTKIENIGYNVNYDESVVEYILKLIKDEKEYGARPIVRAIQNNIENELTDILLENEYTKDYTFNISYLDKLIIN